ncbi:PAS domain-containing protein [Streptomyces nitrosporeus]|uniref:PAS domain-containing protein n=1 Tax=Streptomyces nitrosporeus TaxID=28894 RepID=A0A5J6FBZ4_9ACTN|nr:PAS domain-containing protein [Streptomyces nitrosporeus]QEU73014.1 PAS domain-containing protein [Streptomyces nitrosporeus]GGZ14412.1 diguanylate cyclase [Streptomyces nitrosporeus]
MSASRSSGIADAIGPEEGPENGGPGGAPGSGTPAGPAPGPPLLAALLDGMDAAFCAFDAHGTVTHWNREAERVLGWSAAEAVGRSGFAGWAVRRADAGDVQRRLMAVMDTPGRQVHEFALLCKSGGRVLVRTQSSAVRGADGTPAGVYCAFSEVHARIDLERSIALSEALFEDMSWGVVLVDVDLRPTVVNSYAARALGAGRTAPLGRPLGELILRGAEELEGALQHVLAEGAPPAPADLWVTLRTAEGERRRCWRSGFLRLASPLAEEPVPLGVGWMFQDVTDARLAEQEADRLRFRSNQLHRAARQAAGCEDPLEAATSSLDYALAGFADHVVVDLLCGERLVRAAGTPAEGPGPCLLVSGGSIPVRYRAGHPALQAVERTGTVRASARAGAGEEWAAGHQWPRDAAHALCAVLQSRGRTLGVVTFLRAASRSAFERPDAMYAESVAVRVGSAVDLARLTGRLDGVPGPREA